MSKDALKNLIDLVPDEDIDTLYKVVIKFLPEVEPEEKERQAFLDGKKDRKENGTISHEDINWD